MHVDPDRLRRHVERICRSPRPAGSQPLAEAAAFVTSELNESGWAVTPDPFDARDEAGQLWKGVNLIARHPRWDDASLPRFCVGAHLDSRPDSPGADDNASAVAALLEIARVLPGHWPADPKLSLELVVFDLEENGMLGGAHHAARCREQNVDLRGMVSLEMLGYCDHAPRSQQLPRSLVGLYPDVGNFIAIIGNQNSTRLIEAFREGMEEVPGLPVETLQVPENGNLLQATRLSDHSPFWDAGFAALMITDTSFLRNPHYHTPGDLPETLDYTFLHQVAQGAFEAVHHIIETGL